MLIIRKYKRSGILEVHKILILVFIHSVIVSCSTRSIKQKGKLLAKVGSAELHDSDLKINFSDKKFGQDLKDKMIKDWIRRQLVFKKAIATLSDKEKDKDIQLKDYYESLIIYDYLNKVTKDNTDTSVTEKEMNQYYTLNKKNFETKRNIVRLLYVKVPVNIMIDSKIKYSLRYPDKNSLEYLKKFSGKYAVSSSIDTTKWYYMDDIIKDVPVLNDFAPENNSKYHLLQDLNDGTYEYVIKIFELKIVGETAPFSLVKDKIREIILERRKTQIIKNTENQIYREGELRKLFEISGDKTTI